MENHNFDKRIREKLQGLEGTYQTGDWEKMEQKLDAEFNSAPEMEDVLLDGMAYGSLRNLQVEYNPVHWEMMEHKLDRSALLRRKLYRYKVVELALMFLAIFTILQFLPSKNQNTSPKNEMAHSAAPAEERPSELGIDILDHANKNVTAPEKENEPDNEKAQQFVDESAPITSLDPDVLETKDPSSEINEVPIQASGATDVQINLTETLFEDRVAALVDKNKSDVFSLDEEKAELSLSNRFSNSTTKAQAEFTSLAPIALFAPGEINVLNQTGLPDCALCNKTLRSPIRISIGMAVGPDADYITTPYDAKYMQDEFSQLALGYSGGFTLGFKYNKWELETGAVYASTSYGSRNILEISGSFAQGGYVQQGLAGAQLDIVKVPLNLRYNFRDRKKWNYYLVTGGSVNMAVETLYEYTTETVGGRFNAMASRAAGTEQDASPYDGIFEGGSFLDNTFLTANLGLGVERYFTSRMSIFFQPTYSHQLSKGLGPQRDKINSLSIMTGARVTLKKKDKK